MINNSVSQHWYYCLREDELIVEEFSGLLDFKSLKRLKERQIQDTKFDLSFPLLSDIRAASVEVNLKEIQEYEAYAIEHNLVSSRKVAILTATPMQVAIASLFKSNTPKLPHIVEIFSTLEAAMHWLNRSEYIQDVETLLSYKLR